MKKIKHRLEAFLLVCFFTIFAALPLDAASWLGGWLARIIGPWLSAQRLADENLRMIFPDFFSAKRRIILRAMWDNLGRVAAELSHLPKPELIKRIHVYGSENLPDANKQALFFSGHLGNWELLPTVLLQRHIPTVLVYRRANNPYADHIIAQLRATQTTGMFPKGFRGAVKMARAIKNGLSIAMLIDQKMNDGIAVPFFGRSAMTAPAIAELALRYDLPIIPARAVRTAGAHFDIIVYPSLVFKRTGNNAADIANLMNQINAMLEDWIREYPEQWFWVHRRWPKA